MDLNELLNNYLIKMNNKQRFSDDGIITFNPEKKDNIIPGEKYVISLKLKTKAGERIMS